METYKTQLSEDFVKHLSLYQHNKEDVLSLFSEELSTIKEWERIQSCLLSCVFDHSSDSPYLSRLQIESAIHHSTHGQVQIWWEPLSQKCTVESGRFVDVCFQQVRYGVLKLAPGYLTSRTLPQLPEMFAQLCAFVLTLAEHSNFVHSLLRALQPLEIREQLTAREQDVLKSMALGESEADMTQRFSIALTTVRTHRQHVYHCLNVRTPQDAVLRSFALRLLDWLDMASL